jgi:hypothetical protein
MILEGEKNTILKEDKIDAIILLPRNVYLV